MQNDSVLIFSTVKAEVQNEVMRGSHSATSLVKLDKLQQEATDFYNKVTTIFGRLEATKGGFILEEITIEAEISADGKIGFLGAGMEVGVKGSISFKLVKAKLQNS